MLAAAIITALICLLLVIFRLGKLANWVPEAIFAGFTTGVGLRLLDGQTGTCSRRAFRLKVAMSEAQTSARVARLVAEAKGQYSVANGSAFEQLKKSPSVFNAYQELYRLSLVQPGKTVSFEGFSQAEIRASDLAMIGSSDISVPC